MAQVTSLNGFWPDSAEVRHSGVCWLPLYHDMGLIGCLLAAVERPGDLTLIPPEQFVADPGVWLRTLSATRATISPAPNFAYGLCVDRIRDRDLTGVDLSSWQFALNGAETVVADVARAFCERFSRWGLRRQAMTPVYGLSEAALAVTFSDLDHPFTSQRFSRGSLAAGNPVADDRDGIEIVSVGRPIPGFSVAVRRPNGSAADDDEVGRVWISGPSLMDGYFGDAEATGRVLDHGWLDSGDLGFMHRDELYLTGRAKDVLILRGLNHLPHDVENAVDAVAGVRTGCSAAVSYLPEGASGEVLVALVEHRRDCSDEDLAAMASRCRREILARTGLEATHVEILAPGCLPRTSSGKIRRQEGLRRYLDDELTPPEPVTPLRLLARMARSRLVRGGGERPERRRDEP